MMQVPRTREEFDAMPREEQLALAQLRSLLNLATSGAPLWPSDAQRLRELAAQFGILLQWRREHIQG